MKTFVAALFTLLLSLAFLTSVASATQEAAGLDVDPMPEFIYFGSQDSADIESLSTAEAAGLEVGPMPDFVYYGSQDSADDIILCAVKSPCPNED